MSRVPTGAGAVRHAVDTATIYLSQLPVAEQGETDMPAIEPVAKTLRANHGGFQNGSFGDVLREFLTNVVTRGSHFVNGMSIFDFVTSAASSVHDKPTIYDFLSGKRVADVNITRPFKRVQGFESALLADVKVYLSRLEALFVKHGFTSEELQAIIEAYDAGYFGSLQSILRDNFPGAVGIDGVNITANASGHWVKANGVIYFIVGANSIRYHQPAEDGGIDVTFNGDASVRFQLDLETKTYRFIEIQTLTPALADLFRTITNRALVESSHGQHQQQIKQLRSFVKNLYFCAKEYAFISGQLIERMGDDHELQAKMLQVLYQLQSIEAVGFDPIFPGLLLFLRQCQFEKGDDYALNCVLVDTFFRQLLVDMDKVIRSIDARLNLRKYLYADVGLGAGSKPNVLDFFTDLMGGDLQTVEFRTISDFLVRLKAEFPRRIFCSVRMALMNEQAKGRVENPKAEVAYSDEFEEICVHSANGQNLFPLAYASVEVLNAIAILRGYLKPERVPDVGASASAAAGVFANGAVRDPIQAAVQRFLEQYDQKRSMYTDVQQLMNDLIGVLPAEVSDDFAKALKFISERFDVEIHHACMRLDVAGAGLACA